MNLFTHRLPKLIADFYYIILGGSYRGIPVMRDWLIYFPWNVNLTNYSSWSVIWRFCVTREELELLTDIRDFTTLFGVILEMRVLRKTYFKTENIKCDK